MRLRETIKAARVWVSGPDGEWMATNMDLPSGWYCLPYDGPENPLPEQSLLYDWTHPLQDGAAKRGKVFQGLSLATTGH